LLSDDLRAPGLRLPPAPAGATAFFKGMTDAQARARKAIDRILMVRKVADVAIATVLSGRASWFNL
jgi:hypothetical protein